MFFLSPHSFDYIWQIGMSMLVLWYKCMFAVTTVDSGRLHLWIKFASALIIIYICVFIESATYVFLLFFFHFLKSFIGVSLPSIRFALRSTISFWFTHIVCMRELIMCLCVWVSSSVFLKVYLRFCFYFSLFPLSCFFFFVLQRSLTFNFVSIRFVNVVAAANGSSSNTPFI